MRLFLFLFIAIFFGDYSNAQFAPAAGKAGSTALRHDSSCFVSWAKYCKIDRGFEDISNPDSGYATVGDSNSAKGKALQNSVVSLGDSGRATFMFAFPIINGTGWDFAVFENSFSDTFLEFAFVEVSSDGIHFVRFQSESLTDTIKQIAAFGFTHPENINNLAGKYRAGFGTPFDLEELKDSAGLDVNNIRYVRVVDVIGCVNNAYASRDSKGRKINDPWPTRFASSGFDLDAVGVVHQDISSYVAPTSESFTLLYPNPVVQEKLNISTAQNTHILLYDIHGNMVFERVLPEGVSTVELALANGLYSAVLHSETGIRFVKVLVCNDK